jgi:hypothetical protein
MISPGSRQVKEVPLLACKLEHEILREPVPIAFDGLKQRTRLAVVLARGKALDFLLQRRPKISKLKNKLVSFQGDS